MGYAVLETAKFDGDARMLCDEIESILKRHNAFNEIVSIRTGSYLDITAIVLIEETLTDGSTVFNLELEVS